MAERFYNFLSNLIFNKLTLIKSRYYFLNNRLTSYGVKHGETVPFPNTYEYLIYNLPSRSFNWILDSIKRIESFIKTVKDMDAFINNIVVDANVLTKSEIADRFSLKFLGSKISQSDKSLESEMITGRMALKLSKLPECKLRLVRIEHSVIKKPEDFTPNYVDIKNLLKQIDVNIKAIESISNNIYKTHTSFKSKVRAQLKKDSKNAQVYAWLVQLHRSCTVLNIKHVFRVLNASLDYCKAGVK